MKKQSFKNRDIIRNVIIKKRSTKTLTYDVLLICSSEQIMVDVFFCDMAFPAL